MAKKTKAARETGKIKVIMLGGLAEIGKNLAVIEYEDEMIVVDCGIGFPDDDMPGIDLVIPDFTYLKENASKLKGVFITHGHEDHIGAVPYLLKLIDTPVFATKLAIGILKNKLNDHTLDYEPELVPVEAGDSVKVGHFSVEYIRVNHSIADA
ncbi:MAG: ribonuclease J, partial [Clostridia bacterium]|nr:ribonuclease J [Clostridia bacterium]